MKRAGLTDLEALREVLARIEPGATRVRIGTRLRTLPAVVGTVTGVYDHEDPRRASVVVKMDRDPQGPSRVLRLANVATLVVIDTDGNEVDL